MKRFALAFAVLLAACPPTFASFLLRLDGTGAGRNGAISYNNGQGQSGNLGNVFIGQLQMTFDVGNANQAFNTFCIDLGHYVHVGQTYAVNVRNLGAPPTYTDFVYGGAMAYLYTTFGQSAIATSSAGKDQAAALQLALWRLSLGPTGTLTVSGVSSGILSAYNSFVALGLTNNATTTGRWLDASPAGGGIHRGQSMIYPPAPPQGPPAVPAPGGLVLAASGGIAAAAAALRRRFF